MNTSFRSIRRAVSASIALSIGAAAGLTTWVANAAAIDQGQPQEAAVPNEPSFEPGTKVHIDRSGKTQVGKASFYADRYSGKLMSDGTPMRLYSNNAASLTLPLGTTAKVTNLETGRSAVVMIRDRGPYVKGRIVDLSPATAHLLGISKKRGLAQVEVTPISIPASHADARIASLNSPWD